VGFAFLVQIASLALAVVMLSVGASLAIFAIYGMMAPRRFHTPLPPETEIVSPVMLADDQRGEAALGIFGLICVLASIAIEFVRLYV
jgi:hypothetical protein